MNLFRRGCGAFSVTEIVTEEKGYQLRDTDSRLNRRKNVDLLQEETEGSKRRKRVTQTETTTNHKREMPKYDLVVSDFKKYSPR